MNKILTLTTRKHSSRMRTAHLRWLYVFQYPPLDVSTIGEEVLEWTSWTGLQWWPPHVSSRGTGHIWDLSLWTDRQSHTTENITFPQIRHPLCLSKGLLKRSKVPLKNSDIGMCKRNLRNLCYFRIRFLSASTIPWAWFTPSTWVCNCFWVLRC